ncbi:MAG: hypothetical protein PGN25_17830 [Methylorubrum populi]
MGNENRPDEAAGSRGPRPAGGGHSDRKAASGPREGQPVAGEPDRAKYA